MTNVCMLAYTHYKSDNRVRRAAETLSAQGTYNVLVIVPKEQDVPKTYDLRGVSILELNMLQYQGKHKRRYLASYLAFVLRAFLVCNRLLVQRQVDVFHIHNMPNFLVFAAILPRVFGKKLILDIHDSVPETYAAKFDRPSHKVVFRLLCWEEALCSWLAHHVICVNHPQRDVLVRRGIPSDKVLVSLNVPDPGWFNLKGAAAANGDASKKFRLVYHGTLAKRLGVDDAIWAVGKLVYQIPHLEFHIYGSGDDRERFIKLTQELGLQEVVHFHGRVPLEDLFPIIASMDLGIVGNRKSLATELMLPVKMLEYVALEIPVVVPRLKTIEYYFSDEMVSYFEPGDRDSMMSSILNLYQNNDKRATQARAATRFLDTFGWAVHQKDFLDLYKRL